MSGRRCAIALLASAVLSSILAPAPLGAQEEDAVVVSASRSQQRIRDAIPHTTVLTRQNIRDSQAVDLPSLLRSEAGFEMAQNGGIGTIFSPLSLRGGTSARALVLIDGVRLDEAALNQSALQHIMLDQVERVEIVRGNVSSLYGSNAIGGVIQVFTRRGEGAPAPSAELMAGSRGTSRASAGFGGSLGETRFSVGASRFHTGGISAIDPGVALRANPDRDGYRNDSFSFSLSRRLSPRHEVGVSAFNTSVRLDYDNASAFQLRTNVHKSIQDVSMAQAFWEARFVEAWKSRIMVADGADHRRDTLNGNFANLSNTHTQQLVWDNELRLSPGHLFSAGYEKLRSSLDNYSSFFFGPTRIRGRDVESYRAGYLGRLGRHGLQANVRHDRYSDAGSADTHYLGYGFDLTEAWRLTASHATAFRAPTFLDLDPFFLGDPRLKPERARTEELGVQWAGGPDRVRIVAFRTVFRDAIVSDAAFFRRNTGYARVEGLESSYSGVLAAFDVRASLTLQNPEEVDTAGGQVQRALRRSRVLAALSAHRAWGPWRLGGEIRSAGNHRDADINAPAVTVYEAGYTVVNLAARYHLTKHLYVAARVENALNEKYRLVNGYNPAPWGAFFSVGWQP